MGREGQTNSHNPYEPPQASQQEASGARQEPDFGGDASLSAVIERFKTLYSRGGGTLFSVWLMIMACYLPVVIFGGVIEFMSGAPAPTLETYLEPAETVNPTAPSEALGLVAPRLDAVALALGEHQEATAGVVVHRLVARLGAGHHGLRGAVAAPLALADEDPAHLVSLLAEALGVG
ncbi:MAG: hypothetical protein ACOCV2_03330, partial [Persicimonas sp.]